MASFKTERERHPILMDAYWGAPVLTQPAAIRIATAWARHTAQSVSSDAGDVQANGFQIVEDDHPGQTFTEDRRFLHGLCGLGPAATAVASSPFYGGADRRWFLHHEPANPGSTAASMGRAAASCCSTTGAWAPLAACRKPVWQQLCHLNTLQVDYLRWASAIPGCWSGGGSNPEALQIALEEAGSHAGLTLIHLPVYYGPDPLGGMGGFTALERSNWCEDAAEIAT